MQDFKNLRIWVDSARFAKRIYELTASFPDTEKYGMTSQLRRAASSISANIAEGSGRRSARDFRRFIHSSIGSAKECESFLYLAKEVGYIDPATLCQVIIQLSTIQKMLINFTKTLEWKAEQEEREYLEQRKNLLQATVPSTPSLETKTITNPP